MQRLLVVTPRELTRDVRARREVEAALALGATVLGLCASSPGEEPIEIAGLDVTRVEGDRVSGALRRAGLGGLRRSPAPVRELRGVWRLLRLAKTTFRLVRAGRTLAPADVIHANDLDALPAAWLLARRQGARLVYDAHELYRFMETDPPRLYTAAASGLEGWIGRRAAVVTNCELFADSLERLLRLPRRPVVVLNCPDPLPQLPASAPGSGALRAIYQAATDHPGRPVSDLLEAAAHAPGVEITIRLVELDREALEREIAERGLGERVRIVDPVPPDELVTELLEFDVGVIVNRDATPNVALAVPGKLWEYMMAGLASVVPALPGLAFVDELGVGLTFPAGEPARLGARLQELADDRDRLAALQARARALALERFNSRTQAERLAEVWTV
jgi:glycosyltransferase involved in cell wall biosynthesis